MNLLRIQKIYRISQCFEHNKVNSKYHKSELKCNRMARNLEKTDPLKRKRVQMWIENYIFTPSLKKVGAPDKLQIAR